MNFNKKLNKRLNKLISGSFLIYICIINFFTFGVYLFLVKFSNDSLIPDPLGQIYEFLLIVNVLLDVFILLLIFRINKFQSQFNIFKKLVKNNWTSIELMIGAQIFIILAQNIKLIIFLRFISYLLAFIFVLTGLICVEAIKKEKPEKIEIAFLISVILIGPLILIQSIITI